jgi:hypothetical protein
MATSSGGPTLTARRTRCALAVVAAALAAFSTGASVSHASPPSRTYGAARAAFEAGPTGGVTVYLRSPNRFGVPADAVPTGSPDDIRIYPALEDAEYCASGWHFVGLVYGDDPVFYGGQAGLFEYLQTVTIQFALDGQQLTTEQTAIKRFTDPARFGVESAFVFHTGAFLQPGTLSVGAHTVLTTIEDPVFGDVSFPSDFTVLDC